MVISIGQVLNLVGWVAEDLEELDWSSSYRLAVRADGHVNLQGGTNVNLRR